MKTKLNNNEKFFIILKTIFTESSEDNPISVKEIQTILKEKYDTNIDKRSIDNVIGSFCRIQEDYEIEKIKNKHNQTCYYFSSVPTITFGEAKAIVDMVYSSKFFKEYTKKKFKERMQENFREDEGKKLDKVLYTHLTGNENDESFYNAFEQICNAIFEKKSISFNYSKPLPSGKYKNNLYSNIWPVDTYSWNNTLYLYCWIPEINDVRTFRIDFIKDLFIGSNFVLTENIKEKARDLILDSTNGYGPERHAEEITIMFNNNFYPNIIDKFGKNTIKTKYIDDNHSSVTINECPISPQFYAWIVGFSGEVKIIGNEEEIQIFNDFLNKNF